jgi:hypothetical protein
MLGKENIFIVIFRPREAEAAKAESNIQVKASGLTHRRVPHFLQ